MISLLSQIIEKSAEKQPDHTAFQIMKESVNYAELVQRANNLATVLVRSGVKVGDRVGVYLHKRLESAIAVYGILKAGAAYVPLDPMMPISRLAFILRDCGITHLVTEDSKRKNLVEIAALDIDLSLLVGVQTITDLPFETMSWDAVNTVNAQETPDIAQAEHDMAYIMYTSGSTGEPKGIIHTHYSGLSYARLAAETYGVTSDDRLANFAPLHFDQSTFELFAGPLMGATTVLIPELYTKFPANLSQLIDDEEITIWYSVPFALTQLLLRGVLDERDLSSLRWVKFGGEPFPIKHLRALMQRLPQAKFSNVYGPAEVNQCTYYHVPAPPADDEAIPIGKIWAETEGLVIDDADNLVAPGEIGELVIRSPTMMRGYWAQPELNERAFYHRPNAEGDLDTFYRTGDLVQQLTDNNYMFLGRKDRQIKSRGYRVELDEVEAALLSHDTVEETAVFPVPDADGSQQIIAAVILKNNQDISASNLMAHIAKRLPRYAVPTRIDIMTDFPRTSSGKINRNKLQQQC